MPPTDTAAAGINPQLRRVARFVPRQIVYHWSLPPPRRLPPIRGSSDSGVELITLPCGTGVRLYRPVGANGATPALLWIHGGGYVIGSAAEDDALCRRYARTLGMTVAAVDYRLAPEHPYPAGLEDC